MSVEDPITVVPGADQMEEGWRPMLSCSGEVVWSGEHIYSTERHAVDAARAVATSAIRELLQEYVGPEPDPGLDKFMKPKNQ